MNLRNLKFIPTLAITLSLVACGNNDKGPHYNVNFDTDHGTWSGEKVAYVNEDYHTTFTGDPGYKLEKESIFITVEGVNSRLMDYTFEDNALTIKKDYIVGNILIKAQPKLVTYKAMVQVSNARWDFDTPQYHKQFDVTFTPKSELYRLPDDMEVYVNNVKLVRDAQYEYVPSALRLTIFANSVEGDILISGDAVKLAILTFNGNGGHWGTFSEITKTIYADAGSTFATAKSLAGSPHYENGSKHFDHWTKDGQLVEDDYKIQDGDVFDAVYVDTEFTVEVKSNYFATDYCKKKPKWHEGFDQHFEIKEEDINSRTMPKQDDVKVQYYVESRSSYQDIPFTYTLDVGNVGATIVVPNGYIEGNVQITLSAPSLATITFAVGNGTWDGERTDDLSYTLPTNETYNILEAWRFVQKNVLHQTDLTMHDPVANSANMVFEGWKLEGESTICDVNKEVTSSIKLTASYVERDFESDSWDNVITAANSGLDFLYTTYNTDLDNLLACKRKLVVGNATGGYLQAEVRVIGIGQDTIADQSNADQKAALTFEFCNTFFESKFGQNYKYEYSTIRNDLLNSVLRDSLPSFKILENQGMTTVRPVSKGTYDPFNGGTVSTTDTFFLLSANELALTSSDMPDGVNVPGTEGPVYQYYDRNRSPDKRKKSSLFSGELAVPDVYWIRTANPTDYTQKSVYAIDDIGEVVSADVTLDEGIAIAPAFAVGIADHSYHQATISCTNATCISHPTGKLTIPDSESGFIRNIVVKATGDYLFDYTDATHTAVEGVNLTLDPSVGGAEISDISLSGDHKTVTCSIKYGEAASSKSVAMTLSFSPTQQGHQGTYNLVRCTTLSGANSFPIYEISSGTATATETFLAADGYLFSGQSTTDVVITSQKGECVVLTSSYSSDRKQLELTIRYDAAASKGNINVKVQSNIEGYVGKVECTDCSIDPLGSDYINFPIIRGEALTETISYTIIPSKGYEFSKEALTYVSYRCDASGGMVNFNRPGIDKDGNLTFKLTYNAAASYGNITIMVHADKIPE